MDKILTAKIENFIPVDDTVDSTVSSIYIFSLNGMLNSF